MEILLFYSLKLIICTAVLLGYYYLFLKDKTFHHYNRFYLLSAMILSLVIPAIKVENFTVEVNKNVYFLIERMQDFNSYDKINDSKDQYYTFVLIIAGLVSLYFLTKFLFGIFKIYELKRNFKKEKIEEINFYRTDLTEAPFSYFRNLFWKNSISLHSEIGKQILKHEMVHIEQKHTVDKIFVEIITSFFWFNPFFYLIKKEISLIHEYLADRKSVKHSSTKIFAQMLLESHFSDSELPATSPFLSSNLKKRLTMLQKPKTKYGYVQRVFALPLLCIIAFAYMVNAKNKEIKIINAEIEKAVTQIKKDTVTPKKKVLTEKITNTNQEKININLYDKTHSEPNEYASFYNETVRKRQDLAQKNIEAKQEMTKIIESSRKEMAFDEKFPKNRDYDINPLTTEEKQELKADSEKIAKLNEKESDDGRGNFGLFKFEKTITKVFDLNGNEVKIDQKSPVGNVSLMTISVDGAELFVNGKKVAKEEFLKYQSKFNSGLDDPAKIRLFKIERVGDEKRSYAKKMEIITN